MSAWPVPSSRVRKITRLPPHPGRPALLDLPPQLPAAAPPLDRVEGAAVHQRLGDGPGDLRPAAEPAEVPPGPAGDDRGDLGVGDALHVLEAEPQGRGL